LEESIDTEKGRITDTNTEVSNIKATLGYATSANPAKTVKQIIEENASNAQSYTNTAINTNTQIQEVLGAHRTDGDTLDARFDDIETAAVTVNSHLNTLDTIIDHTPTGNEEAGLK